MSENTRYDEVNVICAEDCGNAPKKELLRAFNAALACNDINFIMDAVSEDIHWNIIGDTILQGKAEIVEMLEQRLDKKVIELMIHNIITHGHSGSVNGILNVENNLSYAFCHIYRFNSLGKNAKIKEITSYEINVS